MSGQPNELSLEQTIAEREAAGAAFVHPADERAVEEFQHPADLIDGDERERLIEQFQELLTPIFLFLAKGRLTGTSDARAWVLLYETRLDLVGHESIADYAARRGVSPPRIHALIKEFRDTVPHYRSSNRKAASTGAKMGAAQRERHEARRANSPLPGGKESFFEGALGAGSAHP